MNELDVEARLRRAVDHAVPDVLGDVLSKCGNGKENIVEMNAKKKSKGKWLRYACSAAAALLLITGGSYAYGAYRAAGTVDSVVSLDVNPSVELTANKYEKIISATALNTDGAEILEGLELKGVDLDTGVRAVIGSMVEHGYLSELQNSILLTVAGGDEARASELESRLSQAIDGVLSDRDITGAILAQTGLEDEQIKQLADSLDISEGKAALISAIAARDAAHTPEQLAALTINELNLLLKNMSAPEGVTVTGSASDKGYIGAEAAFSSAAAHAGISTSDGTMGAGVELDYDGKAMVYEVEFNYGGTEYEYLIDAATGAIIGYLSEPDDDAHHLPDGVHSGYADYDLDDLDDDIHDIYDHLDDIYDFEDHH